LGEVNVRNFQGAQDSMRVIDRAIEEVAVARGEMGAFQRNSVESNLNYLRIAHENVLSSESVIRDADIAKEMAAFTRNQIMVESSTAMLAQANQQHMNVLNLVR
jgi:flagellin